MLEVLEKFPSTEMFWADFKVVSLMPPMCTSTSFSYLDAAVFLQFNLYICLQPEKKKHPCLLFSFFFLQPETSWWLWSLISLYRWMTWGNSAQCSINNGQSCSSLSVHVKLLCLTADMPWTSVNCTSVQRKITCTLLLLFFINSNVVPLLIHIFPTKI